jgi:hypothetical protein
MTVIPALLVILRESGVSRTPRLLDSTTAASGILDHPLSRVMKSEFAGDEE